MVKVKEKTRDRLVIEDFPWLMGLIFLVGGIVYGLLLYGGNEPVWQSLLAPILFAIPAWTMAYRTSIVFDRRTGVVNIDERRIGWHSRHTLSLAEIVTVENVESYTMWSSTWRVELKLRDGSPNVPLLKMFTWREEWHDEVASTIGEFLDIPAVKREDWCKDWGKK